MRFIIGLFSFATGGIAIMNLMTNVSNFAMVATVEAVHDPGFETTTKIFLDPDFAKLIISKMSNQVARRKII